ncbi:MAG: DNA gyrase inhibitor YacG [Yoonia sp.]|uniref:DNA gyrase inhibitor YacG n=1 Tax=Yoonia sp. TaxID=2212373 RepID=UPI00273D4A70|nr:DNA gyrase inhibitor YacG [Yoonia sp.]MDP5086492.1 DNA gyrase inhibitor YacG [Yoonia sp.]MDP5359002.1 DNA gyrase inhibitor YacG [Paracoccaceae bacterium]MDP5362692.1 DNA gyrase inhibitor YacG [Paracoccaceae bacterium]
MACPICDKATETAFRPFCSKRCADIDLARWFSGGYAIPADNPDDAEELENQLQQADRDKPH